MGSRVSQETQEVGAGVGSLDSTQINTQTTRSQSEVTVHILEMRTQGPEEEREVGLARWDLVEVPL